MLFKVILTIYRNIPVTALCLGILGLVACDTSNSSVKTSPKIPVLKQPVLKPETSNSMTTEEESEVKRVLKNELDSAYQRSLSLFPVAYQELELKTAYGTAHVIRCGKPENPPLVLLHGMNASSTMWYPNIQAFSENYCVYAIDFLLEPNRSETRSDNYRTEDVLKWYDEVLKELKIGQCYLVGASRGGWLAVNLALNNPEMVKKMVLLSPAQTFMWISPGSALLANVTYSLLPSEKRLRNALYTLSSDTANLAPAFVHQFDIATEESGINKSIFEMRPFSDKELQKLKMPVLVLIGDQDFINKPRSLRNAKRRLPNVKAEIIAHAGHFLSIDQAGKVNRKILSFLKKR